MPFGLLRTCRTCGCDIDDLEDWKTLCLDCWRSRQSDRDDRVAALSKAASDARVRAAESRMLVLAARISALEAENQRLATLAREAVGRVQSTAASAPFTRAELTDLLVLCHPDRHPGSDRAHRITQRLIALRQT